MCYNILIDIHFLDQNVFVSSSSPLETTSGKRKLKPKENPRKTENSSNGHLGIIGGSLGGVIVIIGTVFFLGKQRRLVREQTSIVCASAACRH